MDLPMARILIVEDEQITAWSIQEFLKISGHEVIATVTSGVEAVQVAAVAKPDLVVMDIVLEGEMDGITAATQIREQWGIPVIYLTAHTDEHTLQRAIATAPFGYLIKPFNTTELLTIIHISLHRFQLEKQLETDGTIQSEALLHRRTQEFKALVENSPDIIARFNRELRYLYINPTMAQITGISAQAFIGRTNQELGMPEALVNSWNGALQNAYITAQEETIEFDLLTVEGIRSYHFRIVPEFAQDGTVESLLSVARDITELKRAQERLQQQAEQERLVGAIAQNIRQSLSLTDILDTTVREVRQFLLVDRVVIYRFNADWSGKVVAESISRPSLSLINQVIFDPCFQGAMLRPYWQGRIHTINDILTADLQPCYVELLSQLQVRAILVIPILIRRELWGLLVAHHCSAPYQWQQVSWPLLQQLSTQVAIGIQQAELYQRLQQLNVQLEEQIQERTIQLQQAFSFEAMLKRITDRVRDSLDETQIMQTAVEELGLGLGVECCDTGIYNPDRTLAIISHEYTISVPSIKGSTIEMATKPEIYNQLLQGQYLQFCMCTSDTALRPAQETYAMLACPIVDDQEVLGDLWLFRRCDLAFDESEIRLVQQVANQCAIALRQARLYQAAQAQVEELERLHQLKDSFLSTISHELRTPIANIKMATEMLETILFQNEESGRTHERDSSLSFIPHSSSFQRLSRYFQILKNEVQREISLIDDLLDLSRLEPEAEPLTLTASDVSIWLAHIVAPFTARAQQQQQQLMVNLPKQLPLLTTDRSYCERILTELLNNACKYTPPGETITVSAQVVNPETNKINNVRSSFSPHPSSLQIAVTNTGIEIPEWERDRIFEKFYRIPQNDPWKYGGTGLGLALVQRLVTQLGATIHVESGNNQTTFILRFPLSNDLPP
jgi:PAS domain S-box-containing protein